MSSNETAYQTTPLRWAVLGSYMFVGALTQVLWINFASINSVSAAYYGVTGDDVDLLSLIFMLVYIVLAIPSAFVLDTRGFKFGAGLGAVLTGVFGFLRYVAGKNFPLVLLFQAGVAVGQPFVLNAVSKLAARWFPEGERAIATGLGEMAIFLGVLLGMLLPPLMLEAWGFEGVLLVLGVLALASMVVFLVVAKERPEHPPGPAAVEPKEFQWAHVKSLFRDRDFLVMCVLVFIGLGAFNAIATWIESIVAPKGYGPTEAGVVGAVMVLGGIVGAVVVTGLSDHFMERKKFIVASLVAGTPLLLAFALLRAYPALVASSLLFGFAIMPALPLVLEFAAEQTAPVPEGTSNGILMMMGQVGGVLFVVAFLGFVDMTVPVAVLVACLAVAAVLSFTLKVKETGG